MIKVFTIGFTGKSAEQFFDLLINAGVKKIIDTRIHNVSQLAGYAKGKDLKYFAREIGKMEYEHRVDYAPTKALLKRYRSKLITWSEYEVEYTRLLDERNILSSTDFKSLHNACFLCSEHMPDQCHRKILAEYLRNHNRKIKIIHLM
jgi:uncharacterized protein (DUF488 family)